MRQVLFGRGGGETRRGYGAVQILSVVMAVSFSSAAWGQYFWVPGGGATTDWSDPGNWFVFPAGPPPVPVSGAGADLTFPAGPPPYAAINDLGTFEMDDMGIGADATVAMTPRAGLPSSAFNTPLYMDTLAMAATATLDMADNDLVVNGGAFGALQALVIAGFGTSGPGIISSTSNGTQILALFDNALVSATEWPFGSGTAIGPAAIVGKYTYFGDVNFDGQVTGDDYAVVDANFMGPPPPAGIAWLSGDGNLDGLVSGDDYAVVDANLGLGVTDPLAPVPEAAFPAVIVALGAGAFLRRQRRLTTPC